MSNVHIIYKTYVDSNGNISVGGIQTYITNLIEVIKRLDVKVYAYQLSDENFEFEKNGITFIGYNQQCSDNKVGRFLFEKAKRNIGKSDLIIFASEQYCCKTPGFKSLAIQHGITWDKPTHIGCSKVMYGLLYIHKALKGWKILKRISKVDHIICVDHNFVNWYRAVSAHTLQNITVVPNFSEIMQLEKDTNNQENITRIIFARRFFEYRGTRIFTEAIKKILDEGHSVNITIAGSGPDETWMKDRLTRYDNVHFIQYTSNESLQIHHMNHIAVIPTIGSEGTSLSLLEAMSAGCAVICTDVGGMTDIIIDGYNGLMCEAGSTDALYKAIKRLVDNKKLRNKLAQNGYMTVSNGFSKEVWENKWTEILENTIK